MKDYQYHIFSPYRVCPLGAHVDHQHGLVTGFAIDKGVDLWFSVNGSSQIDNGELKIENFVNGVVRQTSGASVAYINGVSEALFKVGLCLPSGPMVTDEDVKYIVESIKGLIE